MQRNFRWDRGDPALGKLDQTGPRTLPLSNPRRLPSEQRERRQAKCQLIFSWDRGDLNIRTSLFGQGFAPSYGEEEKLGTAGI